MKMKTFLKTGEFARLCRTTKETLFHYDREGILKPEHVSANGYRHYGIKQYFDFDLISLLRETGSTLEEIRNYREARDPCAYLRLLRERAGVLREEQARLARREAMLEKLVALTEEALAAEYDTLLFEERKPEWVAVVPTKPEKILGSGGNAVECYADCLAWDMQRGNVADPPLGMVIPERNACRGEFWPCHFFTRAEEGGPGDVREIPGGRYAVLFHRGEVAGQAEAFRFMAAEVGKKGLRACGDAYIYDQMSCFLTGSGAAYVAKYIVRVE
ncbi:MAG TPA: MerR family transcriptional regulator [Candidatus Mailhella excrementigallinarum]|nr:MerR family transcriptional regulator [Candidatus Mailhella excrementigallinarum]